MPPKGPEDHIAFLLTCLDNVPAKPDWNKIAQETGTYKSGKFVSQAYVNLRKKYSPLPIINGAGAVPATPKANKKRAAVADDLPEDDDEEEEAKPKRVRKSKAQKKKQSKEEALDEKKPFVVKAEASDDELNGDVTINCDDEGEDEEA